MATVTLRGDHFELDTGERIDNLYVIDARTVTSTIPIQTMGSALTTHLQGDTETTATVQVLTPSQAAAMNVPKQPPPTPKVPKRRLPTMGEAKKIKALDKKRAEIKKKWNDGV